MPSPLDEKFEQILLNRELLKKGEKIFVACSGGPDSVALFHLLKELQPRWKFDLALLHFNHGLRGKASNADEKFVKALAKKTKTPFYSAKGKVRNLSKKEKFSEEEAARTARYEFFQKIAKQKKVKTIVTAHTLNDQAETVLMRVFQGTGLRGLCGIRERLKWGDAVFVRPLLSVSRNEIMDYVKKSRVAFRRDASNSSLRYLRNRIRHRFLPWVEKEINPRILESLARIPESLVRETEALAAVETRAWKDCRPRLKGKKLTLKRDCFLELPGAIQFRILNRGLKLLDTRSGMDFGHWKRLQPKLSSSRCRSSLPKDLEFLLTPSELMLCKKS